MSGEQQLVMSRHGVSVMLIQGEGAEVSPELQTALDNLRDALGTVAGGEVSGFGDSEPEWVKWNSKRSSDPYHKLRTARWP